jgi:PhnB protein
MPGSVNPIPQGYHSVTPYLVVNDAARALDFYAKAFGAKEKARMPGPGGRIMHAEMQIGDSMVMLSDEMGPNKSALTYGGSPVSIFLYVDDVDSVFNQAVTAGAKADMPPQDMFWGDRFGKLTDPFGHYWALATHIEDVEPQEMMRRQEDFFAQMAKGAGQGAAQAS